jgi:glycosyltransferase involved in cell wall biosynthesis
MKSRVLIVNKFYYPRGGDCVCTINLERLLKEQGHEVAIYAMNYPENINCVGSHYFASQIDFSGGIRNKIKAVQRTLGYGDIKSSFISILKDFHPDVVHLQNIHSYLSPVIAEIAKEQGCRVVWTLHDYKLICPAYTCLRNGNVCELCFEDKSCVLKNKCMKNSLAASVIGYLEAKKWDRKRLERATDKFICPSSFMKEKMLQGGFVEEKLSVLCNFVDPVKLERFAAAPLVAREDYYCYVGRLSHEKGVSTLLKAASQLPYKLKVAGDGPIGNDLREIYASNPNIEFLGHCNAEEVSRLISSARFSVIPSEWYENNPLSVIESLCGGTPVIGADMGGIPELISANSGIIFRSGDEDSLYNAIAKAWETEWDNSEIKANSLFRFSPMSHYDKLLKIYNQ